MAELHQPPVNECRAAGERVAKLSRLKEQLLPAGPLADKLSLVVEAVVEILDADLARIWTMGPADRCDLGCFHAQSVDARHACLHRERCLALAASAGRYTHLDGAMHRRVPLGAYKIGRVAAGVEPKFVTNDVAHDPLVHDHAWAEALGLVAFAGYRLLSSTGAPAGVLAMFSRHPVGPEQDALLEDLAATTAQVLQTAAAEQALREKTEELESYFNGSLDLLCIGDVDGHFRRLNPQWEETLGYSRVELEGRVLLDFVHPDDAEATRAALGVLASQGALLNFVNRYRRKDGSYRWLEWRSRPSGRLIHAVARDITERKRVEQELCDSERLYRGVFDASGDALLICNATTGQILDGNRAAAELYGYSREELARLNYSDLAADPEQPSVDPPSAGTLQHRSSNGTVFPVEVSRSATSLGGLEVAIIDIRDVSERQRIQQVRLALERKVQQAERIESLGILAGGIAHDFNNLLTAIAGNISLALAQLPPESGACRDLVEADKATTRAARLAGQMLAYSGRGQFLIERTDLCRLVRDLIPTLEGAVSRTARLELDLSSAAPPVDADAAQIRQMITNLVLNASEAIGEQVGAIGVSVREVLCDEAALARGVNQESLAAGRYVCLEVTDSGPGIAPDELTKIFDPFFTTKFTGRGLGLPAVSGIVRGHKGTVLVESQVGAGTSFRVLLPPSAGTTAERGPRAPADDMSGGRTGPARKR
jgi:PAS domain S-box-containing protein